MASDWLLAVVILMLASIPMILASMLKRRNKLINLPPGPPELPIIGNFHQVGLVTHVTLWRLSKKYGPLMHLGLGSRPVLVVSSPEAAREILKTNDLLTCSRPSFAGARRISYNNVDVALSPYGHYWREARKMAVESLLSARRVESFASAREQAVQNMVHSIVSFSGSEINLDEEILALAVNLICNVAFGEGFRVTKADYHLVHKVKSALLNLCVSDCFPRAGWVVDKLSGFQNKLESVFRESDAFCIRVIDHHKKNQDEENFVSTLMKDENLTQDHVKAMIMDILLGGSDNNATTITWAMRELTRNARVMKKVQDEIRTYMGNRGSVSESDLQHFRYLKMVVKETLRLHIPEELLIPRETTSHFKIDGYDVFPKTLVLVNAWGIARDRNLWEKAEEFLPERFKYNPIDYKGQHFELLPFGSGRRICPGMSFGVALVELALANLLYLFDWKLPVGTNPMEGLSSQNKAPLKLVPVTNNWHKS